MDLIVTIATAGLACLAGVAFGTLFSQRIKDWFAGVEADLRAKANDAGKVVLAAAKAEEQRVRDSARAAADRAVEGAKSALSAEAAKVLAPATPVPTPAAQ